MRPPEKADNSVPLGCAAYAFIAGLLLLTPGVYRYATHHPEGIQTAPTPPPGWHQGKTDQSVDPPSRVDAVLVHADTPVVWRIVDNETNIVCYYANPGLSCVSGVELKNTVPEREKQ